jgi:hypothetical protein
VVFALGKVLMEGRKKNQKLEAAESEKGKRKM